MRSLDPTGEVLLAVLPVGILNGIHHHGTSALLLLADTCRGSPLYLWLVFSSLPVKAASLRRCIISKGGASASSARLCQQAF